MFKVALINPAQSTKYPQPPMGLAIIAAVLEREGYEISLHEAEDPHTIPPRAEFPLKVEVLAMDHPGVVQKVVHLLHQNGVNIQSLSTQVTHAPLSGAPLFDMVLEAGVPIRESLVKVKEDLMSLAREMDLDLSFLR